MSDFPRSPRLLKGAIVGVDPYNPLASVVVFQYNPERRGRRVAANTPAVTEGAGSQARREGLRLYGPAKETISCEIVIDAADALERGDAVATTTGIHPTLASLEMLLY